MWNTMRTTNLTRVVGDKVLQHEVWIKCRRQADSLALQLIYLIPKMSLSIMTPINLEPPLGLCDDFVLSKPCMENLQKYIESSVHLQ